jgi:hypothetical protein
MIREYLSPHLPGFPHHIHVTHEDTVLPGTLVNVFDVLAELDSEMPRT